MRHTSWPNYRNFEFDRFSFSIKSKKLPDSRFKITGSPLTDSSLTDLTTGNYKEFLDYSTISFQRPLACKACSFFFSRCGKSHSENARKVPKKHLLPKLDRPIKTPDPIRVGWKCQTRHFEIWLAWFLPCSMIPNIFRSCFINWKSCEERFRSFDYVWSYKQFGQGLKGNSITSFG